MPLIEILVSAEPSWVDLGLWLLLCLGAAGSGSNWKKLFGMGKKEGKGGGTSAKTDPGIGSDWERAAKIFEDDGRYREAAQLCSGHGHNYEAARLLVQAGALTEAASIFERVGHFLKAAEVCAQSGDNKRAGENYRCHLEDRFGNLLTTRSPADHAEFTRYCRLAGECFERAGLLEQAAEVLERGEEWEEAAALYVKLNRHVKAADLYQRAGAMDQAANVFAQAGDRVRAAQMRGEYLYKQDQKNEAAVQFLLGGDPLRAAEVYEEAGNYLDAARCYEHCGAHRQAAEAYQRMEQFDRAAEMYGRCQEYEKAARLYEKIEDFQQAVRMYAEAGRFYQAAKLARKVGFSDQAIDYLQKVTDSSPDYQAALVDLADSFIEQDMPGVAVEKLKRALGDKSVSSETLDIFYTLAEAHDKMGDPQSAATILKKIVAEDYNYGDAVSRLQELEKRLVDVPTEVIIADKKTDNKDLADGDRYELQKKLGVGGMGVVYRAHDLVLDRVVAYKVLMEQFTDVEDVRSRFIREAKSAAKLNHPNIVAVYDVQEEGGRLSIVMEYVPGKSFFELLQKEERLSVQATLHFMVGVLKALKHAHSQGVVHRDIKPSNVMLRKDRTVKIMDFGLAKVLKQAKQMGSERASGTPLYMSPEQILGEALDFRTDIYAFGGTVYHLLAGEPLFIDGEVLYHHVHSAPRPLREVRGDVPKVMDELVMACLSKSPDERPRSEEILKRIVKQS